MVVNAIRWFSQVADHHPDLEVGWSRVVVRFSTHHARGITAKDFEMANKVEEVALWHPRQSSALSGGSKQLVKPGPARV
jgi:4a-hydroxytetrahydrobiopterin dehydratase